MTVSNEVFGGIAATYGFERCVIGPMDVEKVTADCFEALSGDVFLRRGFNGLNDFFVKMTFAISERVLAVRRIKRDVEMMRLGMKHEVPDPGETEIPEYATQFVGKMKRPPSDTFVPGSDCHIKYKMVGAALLKASIVLAVFSRMKDSKDLEMVHSAAKKDNVDVVAQRLGFPMGKVMKVFLGGLVLVNDVHEVLDMVQGLIIPAFRLYPERRRRRHRSEA